MSTPTQASSASVGTCIGRGRVEYPGNMFCLLHSTFIIGQ